MNQEEKDLLFQDLCVRLPYGVKISVPSWDGEKQECIDKVDVLYSVNRDEYIKSTNEDYDFNIENIKPYLFPLSSMNEEQKKEWLYTLSSDYNITYDTIDWLNKNHFDYRNLIDKNLAIDCTNLNIY